MVNRMDLSQTKILRLLSVITGIVCLAALGLLLSILFRYFAGSGSSSLPATTAPVPDTAVHPFGANLFLEREVEEWKREKTLKMAADAGLDWVKVHFTWESIEPRQKGDFTDPVSHTSSWTKYDQIVDECERYGLKIIARLDRPPAWSRADNSLAEAPPDNYADYGDFVYAFVQRYRGRIGYIQIWNEPNIYPEWGNRPVNPQEYVALLKTAYQRAKEAYPGIKVLSAPLAYTLGQPHPEQGKWISMSDLDYLEAMYAAGAADYFDILSTNAFGFDKPPEEAPDRSVLNFQRAALQREIMVKHGDAEKAVWFNEFGWNAAPESFAPDLLIWQRVSEEDQAAYTIRAIEFARREWPWAGVFMVWYLRQVGNITPDRADYYFRVIDVDFTPRLLYTALQQAASARPAAGRGIYEESHPLIKAAGRRQVVLNTQTSGNAYYFTDDPATTFSLTFKGSHVELLTRRGPLDGVMRVWLDDRPVAGLPQQDGVSYIDLNASEASFGWVTLWRGLEPGIHTIRISLRQNPELQSRPSYLVIDALRVADEPLELPWLRLALLTVLVCATLVVLFMLRRLALARAQVG